MMTQSLYERIGGQVAVEATVNKLYEKILADALLSEFFAETDMEALHRSQTAFVTYAFGGPNNYSGKMMRVAHKNAVENGLSDTHFDAVAKHLKESMHELNVPDELVDEAITIVASTRDDVLNR